MLLLPFWFLNEIGYAYFMYLFVSYLFVSYLFVGYTVVGIFDFAGAKLGTTIDLSCLVRRSYSCWVLG